MELAQALQQLSMRKIWLAVGLLVAAVVGVGAKQSLKPTVYSAAATQMVVDSPRSALGDIGAALDPVVARAGLYARLMTSPEALDAIGRASGIPGNQIAATGPVDVGLPQPAALPTPTVVATHFKLELNQNPALPTVDIYTEAPTTRQAIALANGAVTGFAAYLSALEAQSGVLPLHRVQIRELGSAIGGVVDSGASSKLAVLVAVAVLLAWCLMILLFLKMRAGLAARRAAGLTAAAPSARNGDLTHPSSALTGPPTSRRS